MENPRVDDLAFEVLFDFRSMISDLPKTTKVTICDVAEYGTLKTTTYRIEFQVNDTEKFSIYWSRGSK